MIGAFYLTEKLEAPDFSDEDDELIGLLAAHAAIAITNARLQEQARELSVVAERNRLALELHDAVSQKLFGLVLSAEAAGTLLERDPAAARDQVERLQVLAQEALDELRSLVFELRPLDLERDGLGGALRKHVGLVGRLEGLEVELTIEDEPPADPARDLEVLRIAQEAIQNAVKHAQASTSQSCCAATAPAAARDRGRRRRLRSGRGGDPLAPARPDLDGGAGGAARRHARDRLRRGRRHDGAPGGSR